MNRTSLLFVGIFFTFCTAWVGLILVPYFQIGRATADLDDSGYQNPPPLSGVASAGRKVYAANGCIYCHSQQIRPADLEEGSNRGWGSRRTVARDYINEKPVYLGTMRTGPDLTNIGRRWGKDAAAVAKHHAHLYAPRSMTAASIMPNYRFLYEERKIVGQASPDAVVLPEEYIKLHPELAPKPGYEIVPTRDAKNLVGYLISLDRSYPLPEAPEK
jgi:cytochrome c oxidase cbb3-type subunit II